MFRDWRRALAVALVFAAAGSVSAQVYRSGPPNRPGSAANAAEPYAATSGKFLAIPGYSPLSMEAVQREIGLTFEQKRQLKDVSDGLAVSIQRLQKSFNAFSAEDKQARAKDINDQVAQLGRNAQRKVEAILTPPQLRVVEKIAFQLSAAAVLANPAMQEKLDLSPEQRRRLSAVYEQAGEKVQQLQRDTAAQVMKVLDEDQAAELKNQLDAKAKTR